MPDPADPATPEEYIASLDEPRRSDIAALDELICATAPGLERHLRPGMIGYGPYHYRYASGREGDSCVIGLASKARYISLYVQCTVDGSYLAETYADRLPAADIGKACVRFKRPDDLDLGALRSLISEAARLPPAGAA
ncbi:MAG: DUF1801 domain-containing protein [Solirubrobacteraceae bacterium]